MPTRRRTLVVASVTAAVVVVVFVAALVTRGVLWPNRIPAARYDVRGVDVSAHQGVIDWPVLAAQDIDFAYVKATEGSGFVDDRFAENLQGAREAGLLVGAYHFFSFESPGRSQAEQIIATVPADDDLLPVAVDVEHYGKFFGDPPDASTVREELEVLVTMLREHYGVDPVIYATQAAYGRYVAGGFPDSPLWIRAVYLPPRVSDGRAWAFWQYSHRDRLDGYDGREPFLDLNVFHGDLGELRALRSPG
ncbi:lysozyme [Cellulomonas humilata]|uniref:Lysozyme n=1 Tax=Cellulomonas humilata TaxID=144055 RepID=A0A7Y6A4F0_9CELL|nr:lysozyme [Cellulomonas humilata]